GRRNGVDVNRHAGVARRGAATVDEHDVTVRADATERDGGRARRVGRSRLDVAALRRVLFRDELRQLVEVDLDRRGAGVLKQIFAHRHDRAVRLVILALNARTG